MSFFFQIINDTYIHFDIIYVSFIILEILYQILFNILVKHIIYCKNISDKHIIYCKNISVKTYYIL